MARTEDWDRPPGADVYDDDDDDERIILGAAPAYEEPNLGPDEHDLDLLDGSWEARYYSGQQRTRNWSAVMLGLGLLVIAGLILSMAGVWLR